MQPIRSWTTWERVIRTTIVTAMFTIFCGLCFRDWRWAYPEENRRAIAEMYPDVRPLPPPDERVTERAAGALVQGTSLSDITRQLGEPPVRSGPRWIYFGPSGAMELLQSGGRLTQSAVWKAAPHSDADINTQLIMGIALAPVCLLLIGQWLRVMFTNAGLNEAGLKVRGKPLIPFEAMKSMDISRYRRKGWVEISYELNGQTGTVRLDDYVHREFPAMIKEICARRGFPDPMEAMRREKEAEARAKAGGSL